ncbi:hypothetical protein [Streptomyces glaucus]|uniref:Cytochrome P450 n=1 Tax=Streptomyces glaucus TaxID=284029 RepID=A0ABN3JM40_9ACTN
MVALLDRPDQTRALRENPRHIPGAVEELLRCGPPLEVIPARFTTGESEPDGRSIGPAETVTVALTSAGRDAPVEAGADPDRLDVLRGNVRHTSFGHGIPHCIGAPPARLEAAVALRAPLSRLPDAERADAGVPVARPPAGITRGPVRLPARSTSWARVHLRAHNARGRHLVPSPASVPSQPYRRGQTAATTSAPAVANV